MHEFHGTVRLIDEPEDALEAKVNLDLNRVSIQSSDAEIGSWPHSDVHVTKVKDEIHLVADGETLVLKLENGDFFLDLLGVSEPQKPAKRRRRAKVAAAPVADASPTDGFGDLRAKSSAIYNEETKLNTILAIAVASAAVLIFLGAALTWGPFRLMDPGSFPIARLLAGFGALGALFGLYLGYFDSNRITGSAVTIAAGTITFVVLYFYTRAARLGIGFMLALLGAIALIVVGVLGMSKHGGAVFEDQDEDE